MMKQIIVYVIIACCYKVVAVTVKPSPTSQAAVYKSLRYTPQAIHPLNTGFNNTSILSWTDRRVKDVILTGKYGSDYLESNSLIYSCSGEYNQSKESYTLPLYDLHEEFKGLEGYGPFFAIDKPDGLFDIIDSSNMHYYVNKGSLEKPKFESKGALKASGGSWYGNKYIGDIDGDGLSDISICVPEKEYWKYYWPEGIDPWSGKDTANLGPSKDYENVGASVGYDIDGNWIGKRVKSLFYWAKGYINDKGEFEFGEIKPIYYGLENNQAQWVSWRTKGTSIAPMRLGEKMYLVACGDVDAIVAMPVLVADGWNVHIGKAMNLLATGRRVENANLPKIAYIGDFDGDKQTEIVLNAGADGAITILKGSEVGEFENLGRVYATKGGFVAADTLVVPCRVDWDGDGNQDLIVGDASGYLWYIPGTEDPLQYESPVQFTSGGKIIKRIPWPNKSLQGPEEGKWGYLQPTVGDWDGDGCLDIITNDSSAEMYLYKRTAGITELSEHRITFRGGYLPVAWRSRPAILDGEAGYAGDDRGCLLYLDGDGELAIAIAAVKGGWDIEKSVKLKYGDGRSIKLCGHEDGLWGRTKMAIADWDGDGVWDILFGTHGASGKYFVEEFSDLAMPYWMKNTGTATEPVFDSPKMIRQKNGLPFKAGHHIFAVWPTDINNDGELDIIAGEETGRILIFNREDLKW